MEDALMWRDPEGGTSGGLLLADRIAFYAAEASLSTPFDVKRLSAASYTLTLGPECLPEGHVKATGKTKRVLSEDEYLSLRPNSITVVTTAEVLRLPFYIAGHFNLRIKLIHEGVLVGAGPQVDPGFRGKLSCPLHNISNQIIRLRRGDQFAVIEFYKTTPFAEGEAFKPEVTEADIRRWGENGSLRGVNGYACPTFPSRHLDRDPIAYYVPAKMDVSSSVAELDNKVVNHQAWTAERLKELQGLLHGIQLVAFLAVAVVAVSFGVYYWASVNWTTGWIRGVTDATVKAEQRVKVLEDRVDGLEKEIAVERYKK